MVNYILMDKKEILELRLEGRTYQYIADKAGVSRQRIQQIISPPKEIRDFVVNKYSGYCAGCGLYVGIGGHVHHENSDSEENYNDIENLRLLCISCHRKKHSKPPQFQCWYCGQAIKKGIFCNWDCSKKYHTVTLICSYCGKEFNLGSYEAQLRMERSQSGLIFCSKRCQGKWFGEHYGFGIYPEHRRRCSKYEPFASQIVDRLDKGEKLYKIARNIGYKSRNLSILKGIILRERLARESRINIC